MPPPPPSSSSHPNIAWIIAATAAITLFIAGVLFLIFRKVAKRCQKNKINNSFRRQETTVTHEDFEKFRGKVKGLFVDENGREVLYMRKLEDGQLKATFPKIVFNPSFEEEEENDQEKRVDVTGEDLKKSKQSSEGFHGRSDMYTLKEKAEPLLNNPTPAHPISAPQVAQPPPLPPPPPPPPPTFAKKVPAPPQPPSTPPLSLPRPTVKRNPTPPPPPTQAIATVPSLKPPTAPKGNADKSRESAAAENSKGTVVGQVKLKPLHWDKVLTNVDHSMVWNEIKDGSLR